MKKPEILKRYILFLLILSFSFRMKAQVTNCTFKPPHITIHFGTGNVREVNTVMPLNYSRVASSCPTDGHYTFTPATSDCFRGDWHTLNEDHTRGDAAGNMLLVNSSYTPGVFLKTTVNSLKPGTTYEFGVWLMNVCRITEKCPYPLLPDITITLQSTSGKTVARFGTGEVARYQVPHWTQHRAVFTMPASETSLVITMTNSMHGGCGNDFALDDITFRECVKSTPKTVTKKSPAPQKPVTKKPAPVPAKQAAKKVTPTSVKKTPQPATAAKTVKDTPKQAPRVAKPTTLRMPPPPKVLTTRENALVQRIETKTGYIGINLYDNAEIDGDTVSIYHNNVLLVSRARLSQKAITLNIAIDSASPYHELIMVAENLGSIPPNTSLMVVTAGTKRYEIFISSTEQKNAKVVFDLRD